MADNVKICSVCGKSVPLESRFCSFCASQSFNTPTESDTAVSREISLLTPDGFCPKCGMRPEPNSRFCKYCFTSLVKSAASDAPMPSKTNQTLSKLRALNAEETPATENRISPQASEGTYCKAKSTLSKLRALNEAEQEPMIAEPVPVIAEPVPAIAEPVPAIAEPVPVIAEPAPAITEPLQPKLFCTSCGMPSDEGEKFCGYCGKPLIKASASNSAVQQSAPAPNAYVQQSAPAPNAYAQQNAPEQKKYCTNCGKANSLSAKHCLGCGAKFIDATAKPRKSFGQMFSDGFKNSTAFMLVGCLLITCVSLCSVIGNIAMNTALVGGFSGSSSNDYYYSGSTYGGGNTNTGGNTDTGGSGASGSVVGGNTGGINIVTAQTSCFSCHGSGICQICFGRGGRSVPTYGVEGADDWVECTACHGTRRCKYCS